MAVIIRTTVVIEARRRRVVISVMKTTAMNLLLLLLLLGGGHRSHRGPCGNEDNNNNVGGGYRLGVNAFAVAYQATPPPTGGGCKGHAAPLAGNRDHRRRVCQYRDRSLLLPSSASSCGRIRHLRSLRHGLLRGTSSSFGTSSSSAGEEDHDVATSNGGGQNIPGFETDNNVVAATATEEAVKEETGYDDVTSTHHDVTTTSNNINNGVVSVKKGQIVHRDTIGLNLDLSFLSKSYDRGAAEEAHALLRKAEERYQKERMTSLLSGLNGREVRQKRRNDKQRSNKVTEVVAPDVVSFTTVIDGYAKDGRYREAREMLSYMERMCIREMEADYHAAVAAGGRMRTRRKKQRLRPNVITYNAVLNAYAKASDDGGGYDRGGDVAEEAEELLRWMEAEGDEKSQRDGDGGVVQNDDDNVVRQAPQRRRPKPPRPDVKSYNSCLNAWARSPRKDSARRAQALLEQMERQAVAGNENENGESPFPQPDTVSYATTINAWAHSGEPDAALKAESILERMEQIHREGSNPNVFPSEVAVNAVLNAWLRSPPPPSAGGDGGGGSINTGPERCEEILARMEQLYDDGQRKELKPTRVSYNTVIGSWARSGSPDAGRKAEALLRRMTDMYERGDIDMRPNSISFHSVISAWVRSGSDAAADGGRGAGSNSRRGGSRNNDGVVNGIGAEGRVQGGEGEKEVVDVAEKAERILLDMEREYDEGNASAEPNLVAYNEVINSWSKSRTRGAAERAEALLQRMKERHESGQFRDIKPDGITMTTVMDAWAKNGTSVGAQRAEALLTEMEDRYYRDGEIDMKPNVKTYTSVVNSHARSKAPGAGARAEAVLNRMEALMNDNDDDELVPDTIIMNSVINAYAYSDDPQKASHAYRILQRMIGDDGVVAAEDGVYGNQQQYNKSRRRRRRRIHDRLSYNTVLNACAYTRGSEEDRSAAFEIAVKTFEQYLSDTRLNQRPRDRPNYSTYGMMLMSVTNLLRPAGGELRLKLAENVFYQACRDGYVNAFVLSQLRNALPNAHLVKLLRGGVDGRGFVELESLPKEWTRNVQFPTRQRARGAGHHRAGGGGRRPASSLKGRVATSGGRDGGGGRRAFSRHHASAAPVSTEGTIPPRRGVASGP